DKIVQKVIGRLKGIKTDGVLDVQYLQPYLEERPFSIFNQAGRAEKPDIVAAKLLEGRLAVLVSGTPVVLTLPYLFVESVQSSGDYYQRYSYASFLRVLRMITLGFAVLLPGAYISLQKYHLSVIPLKFMLTMVTALGGIPFRATTEMLFVILLFEIIRETGIRMPKAVGMAMSIVGALVLGETAVRAGIVSSPAVMIVALSSLALYTAPDEVGSTTLLRIIFTLLGGIGGVYLLLIGLVYLVQYAVGINGLGAPYVAPFAPYVKKDMQDAMYRSNFLNMSGKPRSFPNAENGIAKEETSCR
ncbi:MAG: spore germination protein, partial [Candidatus Neoclostridium sp.]